MIKNCCDGFESIKKYTKILCYAQVYQECCIFGFHNEIYQKVYLISIKIDTFAGEGIAKILHYT
jgi:hypothetical protein